MEEEVMKRLEEIRNENAELYEKIAELKKVSETESADSINSENVENLVLQFDKENEAVNRLKNEYSELLSKKNETAIEIEKKDYYLAHHLIPQLKDEEVKTCHYYNSLITQIEKIPDVDVQALKKLLSAVQIKRDQVLTMKDEYEKMKQFIEINRFKVENYKQIPVEKFEPIPAKELSPKKIILKKDATLKPHRRRVIFNIN